MTLRLEFNSFSGSLGADEAKHAVSFKEFNISGNNFSGKIPNWLSKFPVASFTGNVRLCGYPLRKKNQEREIYTLKKKNKYNQDTSSSSLYHSFEYDIKKTSDQFTTMVYFEGCKGFNKFDDLLKASAEMLEKESVGTSYKVAILDSGDVVVVKRVIKKLKKIKDVDGFFEIDR